MSTKTISIRLEAYERLKSAKRDPRESFSQVILRAMWPDRTITGGELLAQLREGGPRLSDAELDAIDEAKLRGDTPEDKWKES
jgi:predicted CopG family antitoxin